jgi:hypothetical protein
MGEIGSAIQSAARCELLDQFFLSMACGLGS